MVIKKIKNEAGFTLLEALVALSITSLALLSLSIGLTHFKQLKDELSSDRQLDWHLFVNQMAYYLESSEFVSANNNVLRVREVDPRTGNKMTAEYRLVNGNYIRRVNNGNQPVLMNVRRITIQPSESVLLISSDFNNNEGYQARIWVNDWYE